jgi:hypothetical protein
VVLAPVVPEVVLVPEVVVLVVEPEAVVPVLAQVAVALEPVALLEGQPAELVPEAVVLGPPALVARRRAGAAEVKRVAPRQEV